MGSQRLSSSDPSADVREVLDAIRSLVRILRLSERHAERAHGLGAAQMFVLQCLDGGDGISLAGLAARTATDQSSVSVVVQKLVDAGLILRKKSADDGRRSSISLTAAGRRVLRRRTPTPQRTLIAAVEKLPAAERRRLKASLETITIAMKVDRKRPAPMFFEDEPQVRRKPE